MPFLPPNQQRQSTESKLITKDDDQNRTCNQQEGLKYKLGGPNDLYKETLGASVSGHMVLTTTRQHSVPRQQLSVKQTSTETARSYGYDEI